VLKVAFAAFALEWVLAAGSAGAETSIALICTPITLPNSAESNPIKAVEVKVFGREWRVTHIAASGTRYERTQQYTLQDTSVPDSPSWSGTYNSNPNLRMVGRLLYVSGKIIYSEVVYDTKNNNSVSATTRARCAVVSDSPSLLSPSHTQAATEDTARSEEEGWPNASPDEHVDSPQAPDAFQPDQQAGQRTSVPMQIDGGAFVVRGSINNQLALDFVLDSGASEVSIPIDVVKTLTRTGTVASIDFLDAAKFQLADGSVVPQLRFRIRSLSVGGRVAEDVVATVGDVSSTPLLGQSFLRRFKSWSIDNQLRVLNLE
jgi:clan AA aspartic protease (TIGR02281 family)